MRFNTVSSLLPTSTMPLHISEPYQCGPAEAPAKALADTLLPLSSSAGDWHFLPARQKPLLKPFGHSDNSLLCHDITQCPPTHCHPNGESFAGLGLDQALWSVPLVGRGGAGSEGLDLLCTACEVGRPRGRLHPTAHIHATIWHAEVVGIRLQARWDQRQGGFHNLCTVACLCLLSQHYFIEKHHQARIRQKSVRCMHGAHILYIYI